MKMLLYRGICLESNSVESTINKIKSKGLSGEEGECTVLVPSVASVRNRLDDIFTMESPSKELLYKETPCKGVYACGEVEGARYYAIRHNRFAENNVPVLITFSADDERVYVDCRDFLCTAFQLWDLEGTGRLDWQRACLQALFGERICRYFKRCVSTTEQSIRIAMGNLAAFDQDVVMSHFENPHLIGGRYGTKFCSAFCVQGPVLPGDIQSCDVVDSEYDNPDVYVDIGQFIGR